MIIIAILQTIFQLTGLDDHTFWYATTEVIIVAYVLSKSAHIGQLIHGKNTLVTMIMAALPYLLTSFTVSLFVTNIFCELISLAVFTLFYYLKFKSMENATPKD